MSFPKLRYFALIMFLPLTACNNRNDQLITQGSQVETRKIESRQFATGDKHKTLRNVIDTLQDLSFVIDKADEELGTVTATKMDGYNLRMTVIVKQKDKKNVIVRANADYQQQSVKDPLYYQKFFTALGKSMFLEAQGVD